MAINLVNMTTITGDEKFDWQEDSWRTDKLFEHDVRAINVLIKGISKLKNI